MSASYNDSVVQNYHGVKLYVGGANQSNYMADFYRTLDMPLSNNNARWLMGFEGYPELNSFVGVKYMITNKKPNSEYGYTFLKEIYDSFSAFFDITLELFTLLFVITSVSLKHKKISIYFLIDSFLIIYMYTKYYIFIKCWSIYHY